jgi:hypothetical protein
VIRLIRTHFVPAALNLYKIREAPGEAGDFFRSVQRQKPQYQGLWVVAPDGTALAAHQETKDISDWYGAWPKKVLVDLEAGIRAFGPIEPRIVESHASLPHRGVGKLPDGSVALAVCDRWVLVEDLSRDPPQSNLGPTILDSIRLTADAWSALAPPSPTPGIEWTVPEAVAREFFPLLSTGDTVFRNPDEVTSVWLAGRIESVEGKTAHLRYEGNIAATHHGTRDDGKEGNQCSSEARLMAGAGTLDTVTGKLTSLTLVYDGRFRNYAPYDDPPGRFGAVVEWSAGSASP